MCSVTVAATGVVYQSDTPLVWRDASNDELEARMFFGVFFFLFFWQITLVFPAQIKTGRQHALKAFQADMKVGLGRPLCCLEMCEMWTEMSPTVVVQPRPRPACDLNFIPPPKATSSGRNKGNYTVKGVCVCV